VTQHIVWTVIVLLVIDLVATSLSVTTQLWQARLLLGVAAVALAGYLVRLAVVTRRLAVAYESVVLTLLAPVLPVAEARDWLPEMEGQIAEAGSARRRMLVYDAVRALPRVWLTAWGTRGRFVLARLAIRCARPSITALNQTLRSPDAETWPDDPAAYRRMLRRFRRLGRRAALLGWCLGDRRERELATLAHTLARWCRDVVQLMRGAPVPPHLRLPTAAEAALLLEINHTVMVLAGLLHKRP
jgi:hypothetical protein